VENVAINGGISSRGRVDDVPECWTQGVFDHFILFGTPVVVVHYGKGIVVGSLFGYGGWVKETEMFAEEFSTKRGCEGGYVPLFINTIMGWDTEVPFMVEGIIAGSSTTSAISLSLSPT
jgi:hypothetical protein